MVEADAEPQQGKEQAEEPDVRRDGDQQGRHSRDREGDDQHALCAQPIDEDAGGKRAEAEHERETVGGDAEHEQAGAELAVDAGEQRGVGKFDRVDEGVRHRDIQNAAHLAGSHGDAPPDSI